MEEHLDNDTASLKDESQKKAEQQRDFVDNQGNSLLDDQEQARQDVEILNNHKATAVPENIDSFSDVDEISATQLDTGNDGSSTEEEECYSDVDIEPTGITKSEDGHHVDSSIGLPEEPGNWNAGDVQAMEVCETVDSVYGTANYVCVSEDLVDSCAVATLCQIQGHTDAVVCSRVSEEFTEHGISEEEDEEYEGTILGASVDSFPMVADHVGTEDNCGEFDSRSQQSPTLREISEGEENSCMEADGVMESEYPVLLHHACLAHADAATVEGHEDGETFNVQSSNEAADVDVDIEFGDVHTVHVCGDVETVEDHANVEIIDFHQDADIIENATDFKAEIVDDHHAASTESDPHLDYVTENSDVAIKGSHPETLADGFRRSGDFSQASCGRAVDSSRDQRPVSEHAVGGKPPVVVKDVPPSDSFKEPKEKVVLRSKKSKRVDSIRKSFSKLGSFGHSNGNGKTKHKKEKEKAKNDALDSHAKPSATEHELLVPVSGQAGGQGIGQRAEGGPQQYCDLIQKQGSLEGQSEDPALPLVTGPQKRISNPLAVNAEKLQEFSTQKQNTMQMMYQQAVLEYEKRKGEFEKSPTEYNRNQMEGQGKIVKRLEAKISSKVTSGQAASCESEGEKPRDLTTVDQQDMLIKYEHAVREHQKWKHTCAKSPTESNRSKLEAQAKAVQLLACQIKAKPSFVHRPTGSLSSDSGFTSLPSSGDSRAFDTSMDSACFMEEKRDSLAGLPPPAHASSTAFNPRHKKNESLGGTSRLEATKKESSILRSHSDSFKRSHKETQDNLRQGNSSDDLSNYKMLAARQAVRKRFPDDSCKSQGEHSENSSDSAIDQISPTSERPSYLTRGSSSNSSLHKNKEIMALDDQDFSSDEENFDLKGGPFSDFTQLIVRPAHLAVLLHYLISNSDASPLLFYIVTETYPQGSGKELRKWAYEIFSTFLVEKAPLKINIDEVQVDNIHSILHHRYDKEDLMKNLFVQARQSTPSLIADLMADFRSKQALGLGSIYGDHELKDNLDHAEESKVIERSLWSHFERFVQDEDNERSVAMAAALAFFFKQHGYTNVKNNMLLERCVTFNVKDKTKFPMFGKPSRKGIFQKGHHLLPQQYFSMTWCQHCQNLLCGVGNQGYQCQKCELSFHKVCSYNLQESCCGKKTRPPVAMDKPKPPFINKLKRKGSSVASTVTGGKETQRLAEDSSLASNPFIRMDAQHEEVRNRVNINQPGLAKTLSLPAVKDPKLSPTTKTFSSFMFGEKEREHGREMPSLSIGQINKSHDKSEQPKSADDTKSSPTHSRSRSPEDGTLNEDQPAVFAYTCSSVAEHSVKPSSVRGPENGCLLNEAIISAAHHMSCDSDFETEPDLPSLDSFIPKEHLKKMKPKEKKRQEVINELFYTERAHVRNLKVMQRLFFQPMRNDQPAEFVSLLFPNIDEMTEVHGDLNKDFKQKRKESENSVVGDFASILVKHFSGEMGDRFKQVCAQFCQKQSQALEVLKTRQRKDPKLASLLQDAASNALCRRLELKDFLPTAMQRLTKYPLLIENLLKYTQPDSEEHSLLQLAYSSSKEILNSVNKAVQDYENRLKLSEMQKRLDKRPLENNSQQNVDDYKNLDLTQHTLLYDGPLTWRLTRDRLINVHVVLLSDILLLLQKQDEKLVLRYQSSLAAVGKTDTRTTPIIKLNNLLIKPVATDKCAFFLVNISEQGPQIYDLVAGSKDEKNKWYKQIGDAVETYKTKNPTKTTISVTKSVPVHRAGSSKVAEVSNEVVTQVHADKFASTSEVAVAEETIVCTREDVGQETLEQNHELETMHTRSASFSESLDKLRQTEDSISRFLFEKIQLVSHFSQQHEEDTFYLPDLCKDPPETKDPLKIVESMMTMSCELQQQLNNSLNPHETPISYPLDVNPLNVTPDSEFAPDQLPPPVPPRSPRLNVPPLPPRLYKTPVKISSAQLANFCFSISKHLVNLLEAVAAAEDEKKRLEDELHQAHRQLALAAVAGDAPILNAPICHSSCMAEITDNEESLDQFEDCQSFRDENGTERRISGDGDSSLAHVPFPEVHILSDAVEPSDDTLSSKDIDLETNVGFDPDAETINRSTDDGSAEFQDVCVVKKNIEDCVGDDRDADCHYLEHIPSNVLTTTDDAENLLYDSSEETFSA